MGGYRVRAADVDGNGVGGEESESRIDGAGEVVV